jgi:hypothetical protein
MGLGLSAWSIPGTETGWSRGVPDRFDKVKGNRPQSINIPVSIKRPNDARINVLIGVAEVIAQIGNPAPRDLGMNRLLTGINVARRFAQYLKKSLVSGLRHAVRLKITYCLSRQQ